jgi:LemA protein
MSLGVIIILAIVVVVGLALLLIYNNLVRGRLQVREGWSAVEVQLQRRASLIPNIVETVKGTPATSARPLRA